MPCWIAPRDVHAGKPFDDEIAEAIEASRAMLLIFSDHCNENDYIRREITVAGESHKVIIPFRIEDAEPRRGLPHPLSPPASTRTPSQATFQDNSRITLECLGTIPGNKFLDGHTQDSTVGLAPYTGGAFTGTAWRAHSAGGQFWRLENLGKIPGPAVWLDGRTGTASVGLAPHTNSPFAGATWEIKQLSQDTIDAEIRLGYVAS